MGIFSWFGNRDTDMDEVSAGDRSVAAVDWVRSTLDRAGDREMTDAERQEYNIAWESYLDASNDATTENAEGWKRLWGW